MKWTCAFLLSLFSFAASRSAPVTLLPVPQEKPSTHDRQFWLDIAKNKYALPPGSAALPLARELTSYFASPDPQLRDDLAYSILFVWIVHRQVFTADELLSLESDWQSNLRVGIGESGTDSVLRRSFSALCLAAMAERDLKSPFLGEQRYRSLLGSALDYLRDERDARGFDPVKGWLHSAAHTADLLSFLAANPLLKPEDQPRILHAVALRLSSAHQIFSYGEQDRLAATVTAIAARKDFDAPAFHQWLTALNESDRQVWKSEPPDENLLKTYQNNSYLLQALAARLYAQPKSPAVTAALDEVTQILRDR